MADFLELYKILYGRYGYAGWWPVFSKRGTAGFSAEGYRESPASFPLADDEVDQIIIGAVLTQNTSWSNVEKAFSILEENDCLSRKHIISTEEKTLREWIRSSGCYNQKAKKLKNIFEYIGSVNEPTRSGLLSVWGIGPETADSILLYGYAQPLFIADAYAKRVFSRIGLINADAAYESLSLHLNENIPKDAALYRNYHALIIAFGKEFCRKKPVCIHCPLGQYCSFPSK